MDKYYAHIENDILVGRGQVIVDNTLCIEVTKDIYDNIDKYIYKDGEIILDPDYEKKQEEKRKQEEANLIKEQLDALDLKSIRAIRSNDTEYIQKYEAEAKVLRDKLKELS